jgi:RimJ/RimL family protein N-acetyltransferase
MTAADQPVLERLLGDPEVMWVYGAPFDTDRVRAWIDWNVRLYRERGFGLWLLSLRETDEFVGECGLTPQVVDGTTEIEVGYQLHRRFWGTGLATEAAAACRDYARDVAGLDRLVALIDPRNVASQRVAAKIGLCLERHAQFPTKVLGVWSADLGAGQSSAGVAPR